MFSIANDIIIRKAPSGTMREFRRPAGRYGEKDDDSDQRPGATGRSQPLNTSKAAINKRFSYPEPLPIRQSRGGGDPKDNVLLFEEYMAVPRRFSNPESIPNPQDDSRDGTLQDRKTLYALLVEEMNQTFLDEEFDGLDQRMFEETPEFIEERLQALDRALQRNPTEPAYDQAERISSEYMNDPEFRLMVLRANSFDPNKAAMRLEKFMEGQLKYYCSQALATKPTSLIDLDGASDQSNSIDSLVNAGDWEAVLLATMNNCRNQESIEYLWNEKCIKDQEQVGDSTKEGADQSLPPRKRKKTPGNKKKKKGKREKNKKSELESTSGDPVKKKSGGKKKKKAGTERRKRKVNAVPQRSGEEVDRSADCDTMQPDLSTRDDRNRKEITRTRTSKGITSPPHPPTDDGNANLVEQELGELLRLLSEGGPSVLELDPTQKQSPSTQSSGHKKKKASPGAERRKLNVAPLSKWRLVTSDEGTETGLSGGFPELVQQEQVSMSPETNNTNKVKSSDISPESCGGDVGQVNQEVERGEQRIKITNQPMHTRILQKMKNRAIGTRGRLRSS